MIWTIFCLNVLTVVVAFKKRMILYALLNAIFLFLVTGQAFQIQDDFASRHTVYYLNNFISDVGFSLALRYVLGLSLMLLVLALVSRGYYPQAPARPPYTFAPSRGFYVLLFSVLCLVSAILIFAVVGLSEFLHSTRPGFQSGSTVFLVLLSLGLMPLLFKIIYKGRICTGDIACFLISFAVTGAMGRISAGFYLLMVFLALYHTRGWADARLTPKLIGSFLLFGASAVFVFVAYGAIRGAQAFVHGSLSDLLGFIQEHPEQSVLSLEWNYRFDIEGMSGTAGAFTQYLSYPHSATNDYGISWLIQGAIQWWPGFLKPYASSISDLSTDLNWYPYSIVATGVESFFMSFGWSAVLIFPLAVYLISWRLPLWFQRAKLSPAANFVGYVLMAWSILFVRGPLIAWIAFCFSYSVIPLLFWPLFSRNFKRAVVQS